jgi:tetratricopeptide (TPR) repeat protein
MTGSRRTRLVYLALTVLLVGALGDQAAAKKSAYSEAIRAARLINEWRYGEARKLTEKLAKEDADSEEVRYLRSQLAFVEGNYAYALDLLDGLDGSSVGGNVGDLRALVASTYATTKDFKSVESKGGHFVIYYPAGKDEALVDLAGEVLEKAYSALSSDFGYTPPDKIRIEFLSAPSDLARVSTLTEKEIETTGTIALCKYGKLMVVTPRATVFGYAWMDTIVHEYVHYVVSRSSHDNVPVWLHEGLARFEQIRWRSEPRTKLTTLDENLLATALKKNSLISFDDMHPSMAKLPSQEAAALAFAEVYTMIGFVHETIGYAGIREIVRGTRDGKSARKAVADAMGMSWAQVERAWKKHLRSARLKTTNSLAARAKSRRIRFKKGDSSEENVGLDEVQSKKARKFTRLGGLLRSRGMTEAAAIEYEKALDIVGDTDLFIASKLSRTYLELGKYERAIELAAPLVELDESDSAPATTLGLAYQATEDSEKARDAFETALRITPFDPAVRCGLAEAYENLNEPDKAKRESKACRLLRQ